MKIKIRIPKSLLIKTKIDLKQSHAHAAERVGFLFGKLVAGTPPIILMTEYRPVDDDNYIHDEHVGAKINAAAIRAAMQKGLSDSLGIFHVHMHEWGSAGFSGLDLRESARLIPSFQAASPQQAHGAIVLTESDMAAMVWLPGKRKPVTTGKISVIGWPLSLFSWGTHGR